jgi:hypothetical protein
MAKALLREMLGVAKKRPELQVVGAEGVRNVTQDRILPTRLRPLERRRLLADRQTG